MSRATKKGRTRGDSTSKKSQALGKRLRSLARRIQAEPWNAPGTDKTWVVRSWRSYWTLMDSIERVDP